MGYMSRVTETRYSSGIQKSDTVAGYRSEIRSCRILVAGYSLVGIVEAGYRSEIQNWDTELGYVELGYSLVGIQLA